MVDGTSENSSSSPALHSQALLRGDPDCSKSSRTFPTKQLAQIAPRRARLRAKFMPRTKGRSNTRGTHGDPRQDRQGLRARRKRRRQTSRTSRRKLNEEELREFRSRFGIPISDDQLATRRSIVRRRTARRPKVHPRAPARARRKSRRARSAVRTDRRGRS